MRVWRVEHELLTLNGFPAGPYSAAAASLQWSDAGSPVYDRYPHMYEVYELTEAREDSRHPSPTSDPELQHWFTPDHVCAFATLAYLQAWFGTEWMERLVHNGFHIREYEALDARVGKFGQVVFTKAGAQRMAPIPQ